MNFEKIKNIDTLTVYQYGKTTIQYIFLFFLLLIVISMFVILFHKYFYPFWRTQPVAWTTIFPSKRGIIVSKMPIPLSVNSPYSITTTERYRDYSDIAELLNKNYIHQNTIFKASYTAKQIQNISETPNNGFMLLLDNNNKLVGCICYQQINFVDGGNKINCYWIDKLCVDKTHRNQKLSSVLISNTISHKQSTQPSQPIVALFHKEKRMPFPEIYHTRKMYSIVSVHLIISLFDVQEKNDKLYKPTEKELVDFEKTYTLEKNNQRKNIPYFSFADNLLLWSSLLHDEEHHIYLYKTLNNGIQFIHLHKMPVKIESYPEGHIWELVSYIGEEKYVKEAIHSFIFKEYVNSHKETEIVLSMEEKYVSLFKEYNWNMFDTQYYYFYNYRTNNKLDTALPILPFGNL